MTPTTLDFPNANERAAVALIRKTCNLINTRAREEQAGEERVFIRARIYCDKLTNGRRKFKLILTRGAEAALPKLQGALKLLGIAATEGWGAFKGNPEAYHPSEGRALAFTVKVVERKRAVVVGRKAA